MSVLILVWTNKGKKNLSLPLERGSRTPSPQPSPAKAGEGDVCHFYFEMINISLGRPFCVEEG